MSLFNWFEELDNINEEAEQAEASQVDVTSNQTADDTTNATPTTQVARPLKYHISKHKFDTIQPGDIIMANTISKDGSNANYAKTRPIFVVKTDAINVYGFEVTSKFDQSILFKSVFEVELKDRAAEGFNKLKANSNFSGRSYVDLSTNYRINFTNIVQDKYYYVGHISANDLAAVVRKAKWIGKMNAVGKELSTKTGDYWWLMNRIDEIK